MHKRSLEPFQGPDTGHPERWIAGPLRAHRELLGPAPSSIGVRSGRLSGLLETLNMATLTLEPRHLTLDASGRTPLFRLWQFTYPEETDIRVRVDPQRFRAQLHDIGQLPDLSEVEAYARLVDTLTRAILRATATEVARQAQMSITLGDMEFEAFGVRLLARYGPPLVRAIPAAASS